METYENLDRYGQAIEHLETVLRWAHGNGTAERAGLANFEVGGLRVVSRHDLSAYAAREETVFDAYIEQRVLPQVRDLQPHTIGFSFSFLHQGFALIRFAKRIRECYPAIRLILGGPMAACWRDVDWGRPPLDLFDAVFSTWPGPRPAAAGRVFPFVPPHQAFFPDLQDLPRAHFFAPQPILPLAFRLGCSYGGCRFCPDYQSRGGVGGEPDGWLEALEEWLTVHGATVVHLTDSCVEPKRLDRLAEAVVERQWPVRWYGFVRFTESLLVPGRLERWARGGCGLLEFGLETAAEELLHRMNKGISIRQAAQILHRSAGCGIRNFVYLLFGFPGETAGHQQETLEFVRRHRDAIQYLNNSILNLPRHSPIARLPRQFGIHALTPFAGEDSDLSLYTDFVDHLGSARQRARRFLRETFLAEEAARIRTNAVPPVFKSNHAIFFNSVGQE